MRYEELLEHPAVDRNCRNMCIADVLLPTSGFSMRHRFAWHLHRIKAATTWCQPNFFLCVDVLHSAHQQLGRVRMFLVAVWVALYTAVCECSVLGLSLHRNEPRGPRRAMAAQNMDTERKPINHRRWSLGCYVAVEHDAVASIAARDVTDHAQKIGVRSLRLKTLEWASIEYRSEQKKNTSLRTDKGLTSLRTDKGHLWCATQ